VLGELVLQRSRGRLRHLIAVAMDQPPAALLAAEDVRHAHRQGGDCSASSRPRLGTLNPNAERKIAARARAKGDKLNIDQLAVCESRGRLPGVLFDPFPAALVAAKAPDDGYIIRVRPQSDEWLRITCEQGVPCPTVRSSIARKSSVDTAKGSAFDCRYQP
jgi:hypothetical protein